MVVKRLLFTSNVLRTVQLSLQSVLNVATTWRIHADMTATTGTALVTVTSRKGKKHGKAAVATAPAPTTAAPNAAGSSTTCSADQPKKKTPPRPCKVCEGNHWDSDCPIVAECAKEHKKKSQATPRTVQVTIARACLSTEGDAIKSSFVDDVPVGPVLEIALSINPTVIQLDNQASISIFKDVELLKNVRPAPPFAVSGITTTGGPILATEVGDFNGWKDIYACRDAFANLISFAATKDYCVNLYDSTRDVFTSTPPDGFAVEFHESDGLYVHPIQPKKR
jgi:hypothetical protein